MKFIASARLYPRHFASCTGSILVGSINSSDSPVEPKKASEPPATFDPTFGTSEPVLCVGEGDNVGQSLMCPLSVVMGEVLIQGMP